MGKITVVDIVLRLLGAVIVGFAVGCAARTNLASGGNPHTYSGSTRLVRGHGDKLHHV